MMEKDYLVVWHDVGAPKEATVVRVVHPPHDEPRGSILDEFIRSAVRELLPDYILVTIDSAMELPAWAWHVGMELELGLGDSRVGKVEATTSGWVVTL